MVTDRYVETFPEVEEAFGRQPSWTRELRREAIDRFARLGFPTTHQEDWRFTNLAEIEKTPFVWNRSYEETVGLETRPGARLEARIENLVGGLDGHRLVFVDGRLQATSGEIPGVVLRPLQERLIEAPADLEGSLGHYAPFESHPFTALNTAYMDSGALLRIPDGLVLDRPIHLVFVNRPGTTPRAYHPRNLILVGSCAQVEVVESYLALDDAPYLDNVVTEVSLAPGARLIHHRIQRESLAAFHMATLQVVQGRDSTYTSHALALGGRLARTEITVTQAGAGATACLNGLYLAAGSQHLDNQTLIDHAHPHGTSQELYKGVLADRSRGVFNGRVVVRPGGVRANARQTNRNLLLSEDAEIHTKPQLEILNNDVKCSHGSTIGQLDPDSLFYLRSRGLDEPRARNILVRAFVGEVVDLIHNPAIRSHVEGLLAGRLPGGTLD